MRVLLIMFVIGVGIACTLKIQHDSELAKNQQSAASVVS